MPTRRLLLLVCVLSACGCVALGCRRQPQAADVPGTGLEEVALTTPQDSTRSLLQHLKAQLAAVAAHDRTAARQIREGTIAGIVAGDHITQRLRKGSGPAADEARLLSTLVDSWAAVISYYAAGLRLDQMKLHSGGPEAGWAIIDVPAQGQDDLAIVRVTCRRQPSGAWRVSGLELAPPPRPASAPPSSQPTAGV